MKPILENLLMRPKSKFQIFFWPIVFGVLTLIGLIVALMEEGVLEDISNTVLALPIIAILYFYYFKK